MTRLLDVLVAGVDAQHRALGHTADRAAVVLERAAGWCRWIAAATRACP